MNAMTPLSNEEFQELAIAHLLGELDASGRADFEAELSRRGAEGRDMLRKLEETLGVVALAASSAEPPPSLRGRVLASVGDRGPRIVTVRRAPPWLWAAAAVLAGLSIGLGIWTARLANDRSQLRAAIARILEDRAVEADSARARLADLQEDLEFVGGPGSTVHGLVGTSALPQAGARIFLDPVTGRAILFAYDLPVVSVDQLYELWAIGPEGPRPAGVFRPNDHGRALLEIQDPDVLRDVRTLAVTVEPVPGAEQPTGEILLSSGQS